MRSYLWTHKDIALLYAVADHYRGYKMSHSEFCSQAAAILSQHSTARSAGSVDRKIRNQFNIYDFMEKGTEHPDITHIEDKMMEEAKAILRKYFSKNVATTATSRDRETKMENEPCSIESQSNQSKRRRFNSDTGAMESTIAHSRREEDTPNITITQPRFILRYSGEPSTSKEAETLAPHESTDEDCAQSNGSGQAEHDSKSQDLSEVSFRDPLLLREGARAGETREVTDREKELQDYVDKVRSSFGSIELSAYDTITFPRPPAHELRILWEKVGDEVKSLCYSLTESDLTYLVALRQAAVNEICDKVFGKHRLGLQNKQWKRSDDYWRALGVLGATIRSLAILVHRQSDTRMQKKISKLSKTMAVSIYKKLTRLVKKRGSVRDTNAGDKEIQSQIKTGVTTSFQLRISLELSTKQYRVNNFEPGSPFDERWMRYELANGFHEFASQSMIATLRVHTTVFPALIELPEEILGPNMPINEWKKVMPTNKKFVDLGEEQHLDKSAWV